MTTKITKNIFELVSKYQDYQLFNSKYLRKRYLKEVELLDNELKDRKVQFLVLFK